MLLALVGRRDNALRVEEGRIVEHWGVPDRLGVLFQLGLARPPGA